MGAALEALVAAARDVALSLGWEPQRTALSSRTRTMVYRRDGYACVDCGEDDITKLSVDHRIPVDAGGTNDADNLRTLCRRCNSVKGTAL